ncbi:MAG: hypothetical protein H6935_09650 [Thiobacillus sp.]|nr:hypothetical protein [Thiobacillus sp.]
MGCGILVSREPDDSPLWERGGKDLASPYATAR